MMATVASPNERASIWASAVASGLGELSSPAARSARSVGSARRGSFELTGVRLGQLMADLGERRSHARVEIIDEGVEVFLARGWKRPSDDHLDVAVGE